MSDFHAIQLTGSACQGRNCACASCAMAVAAGTRNADQLSADQVRHESGVSCIPGVDTPSGGLFINDVIRVGAKHGVKIDYGNNDFTRWPASVAKSRLTNGYGAIFLGDYDQIHAPYRAPGSTFKGDHSGWAHDYRTDLPAFGHATDGPLPTVCWHDPLRNGPIRLPYQVLLAYWQKDGSPVKGLAGFVKSATYWGSDVPARLRAFNPTGYTVAKAVEKANGGYGSVVNMSDLDKALKNIHHNYGSVIDPSDLQVLVDWAKRH